MIYSVASTINLCHPLRRVSNNVITHLSSKHHFSAASSAPLFQTIPSRIKRENSRRSQRKLLWRMDSKKRTPKPKSFRPPIEEDTTELVAPSKAITGDEVQAGTFSRLRQKNRVRPIAPLPRNHVMYIKYGPALTVANLEEEAPSVFFESPYLKKRVIEKRLTVKGDGQHTAPDTPFWRLKKKKKSKIVKWGENDPVDKPVQDLRPTEKEKKDRWEKHVSPERCVLEMKSEKLPEKTTMEAGKKLIQVLRQRAVEYSETGINPDYIDSMEKAIEYYPGMEKLERRKVMLANKETFRSLIEKGMGSIDNFNLLIRAYAYQKDLSAALQVHDQMLSHGYDVNTDTYVGLIMAADDNAPLSRQIYMQMRQGLISPDTKLYTQLIKCHTKAQDLSAGFSLLRKMEDEGMEINVVTHTVLIDGLVETNQLSSAWEQFHAIRTWKNIKPDEVLFTVMIKACAKAEEAERALNIYDDMRTEKLYPTDVTYTELIHALSTRSDFGLRAFDFKRHMEAEGMPLTPIVYDHLLRACASLGDIPRARQMIQEMHGAGISISPNMYNHLLRTFSSAMQLPKSTDFEKVAHLRYAWHVLGDARQQQVPITTSLLNELLQVYIVGGWARYAVELLKQYAVFECQPNIETYGLLLNMFVSMNDFGRYFAFWDLLNEKYTPTTPMLHTALHMAISTQSANKTCMILEAMYQAKVFPTPDLTTRLAKVGRQVLEIHRYVAQFIELNKETAEEDAQRTQALLQAHVDTRNLILATEGKRDMTPTVEQDVRKKYFAKRKAEGVYGRKWLPKGEYQQLKKKGGDLYSYKRDKPKPMTPLRPNE